MRLDRTTTLIGKLPLRTSLQDLDADLSLKMILASFSARWLGRSQRRMANGQEKKLILGATVRNSEGMHWSIWSTHERDEDRRHGLDEVGEDNDEDSKETNIVKYVMANLKQPKSYD